MDEPIVLKRKRMLKAWGLDDIPNFPDVPPKDDPGHLSALFTGRKEEMDRIILTLLDKHNVLVRGMWGVGKTTFILQTLWELVYQTELIEENILPIYIDNFKGGTLEEFHRILLFALASRLIEDGDKDAQRILTSMRGFSISHTHTVGGKASGGINIFSVGSLGVELGREGSSETSFALDNPEYWVETLLDRAYKRYGNVIIAIDDLDKTDPNPEQFLKVRAMLDSALPILRSRKCAFILTGRTLTVAQDIYGSILGIIHRQLQLPPLSPEDLHEIAIKTLNLARTEPRDDPHPFSEEALEWIIEQSHGIPRQFNLNCTDVFEAAVRLNFEVLDLDAIKKCFEDVKATVSNDVDANIRQLLYIAQQHGGFSQDNRKALDQLGWGDFLEVLPMLDYLVQRDLMLRETTATGLRFTISPRAATAAQLPAPSATSETQSSEDDQQDNPTT